MKIRAIRELVEMTIIQIITYGSEGWKWTKEELKNVQAIFYSSIKTMLMLCHGKPISLLQIEVGFIPMELIINGKQLM